MIKTFYNGTWVEDENLIKAFGLQDERYPVISLVGGGGKTTTSRRLMRDFYESGKRPIVTTTTHMQKEIGSFYVGEEKLDLIEATLEKEGQVWAGRSCGETMMKSFSLDFVSKMSRLLVPLIVEADGAKMMPCKVPSDKEPVIIAETTLLLAVYGMDAVGKKLKESCFRLNLVADFLGKSEEEILMPEDIVKIASSYAGGKKGLKEGMDYQVILNKADNEERESYATEIAKGLQEAGITKVHMSSFLIEKELLGGRFS